MKTLLVRHAVEIHKVLFCLPVNYLLVASSGRSALTSQSLRWNFVNFNGILRAGSLRPRMCRTRNKDVNYNLSFGLPKGNHIKKERIKFVIPFPSPAPACVVPQISLKRFLMFFVKWLLFQQKTAGGYHRESFLWTVEFLPMVTLCTLFCIHELFPKKIQNLKWTLQTSIAWWIQFQSEKFLAKTLKFRFA